MNEKPEGKISILVVEDEPDLCEAIVSFLELEGFQAAGVGSVLAADVWLKAHSVDIVILDVGLPDRDGISWIRQAEAIRGKGLIVASARGNLPDRIRGLAAGADAYLVKPVEFEELRLIVDNVANRLGCGMPSGAPGWKLDSVHWQLTSANGDIVKLTRSETKLLRALAASPGQAVNRDELIRVLGYEPDSYDPRRMEILVRRLRNKVSQQIQARLPLETVHGVGYAFAADIVAA
ncbi:MAG: response regulator transcription factor [Methylomonas sp.]|nr:response regulator transcription factor [Methylomonas sp.]